MNDYNEIWKSQCESGSEDFESSYVKMPMAPIRNCIRKNKRWNKQSFNKKTLFLNIEELDDNTVSETFPSYKRWLTIRIPSDAEVKTFTPGSRIKSVSNFADVNESGSFYGALLKKGEYRRSNEDRVYLILC